MLTGRRLFKAASLRDTIKNISETPIPRVSSANPGVPGRLEAIAMRALDRSPDARYQSAAEMADALDSFLVERRYRNQELANFMGQLFARESTRGRICLNREQLQALIAAARPTGTTLSSTPGIEDDDSVAVQERDILGEASAPIAESSAIRLTEADLVIEGQARRPRKRRLPHKALPAGALGLGLVLVSVLCFALGRRSAPGVAPVTPMRALSSPSGPTVTPLEQRSPAETYGPPTPAATPQVEPAPSADRTELAQARKKSHPARDAQRVKNAILDDPFSE
jgi:hypothetical protein